MEHFACKSNFFHYGGHLEPGLFLPLKHFIVLSSLLSKVLGVTLQTEKKEMLFTPLLKVCSAYY